MRVIAALSLAGLALASPNKPSFLEPRAEGAAAVEAVGPPKYDTERLVGSEYTPWRAGNQLWWLDWEGYKADVTKELHAMNTRFGFTAVRMFLHDHLWDVAGPKLLDTMDKFLTVAEGAGIQAGFVFFDDCWNKTFNFSGGECVPQLGVHNGCWIAAPQNSKRQNGTAQFENYVRSVVSHFKSDPRVAWWEIYNEPQPKRAQTGFSFDLRDAAYKWAKSESPTAPVIACWDDSNDTDIVDSHQYYVPSYADYERNAIFKNPAKGGIATEAGCRWYQGTAQDSGSPLVTINWLEGLRQKTSKAPFVPGVMLSWEVMVGHSMTRYHWGVAEGTPEPAVPWCGMMYPDGSPVSYTEAAAIRKYMGGKDDFLFFANFQNASLGAGAPESYLRLHPVLKCDVAKNYGCYGDHARILPNSEGLAGDYAECGALCHDSGFAIAGMENGNQCWCGPSLNPKLQPVNASECNMPCPNDASEMCGAGYLINVFQPDCKVVPPTPGQPDTTKWAGWAPSAPPAEALYELAVWPEAAPAQLEVTIGSLKLTLTADASDASLQLGSQKVNVTGRMVFGGWNIVRLLAVDGHAKVWLNPNFADITGASLPPADLQRPPAPPTPLIEQALEAGAQAGGLSAAAVIGAMRIDYASVLPASEF